MSDIVERLRAEAMPEERQYQREARVVLAVLLEQAADEIERLRGALRAIAHGPPNEGDGLDLLNTFVEIAREALKEKANGYSTVNNSQRIRRRAEP